MNKPGEVRVVFIAHEPDPYTRTELDGFAYSIPRHFKFDKTTGQALYYTRQQKLFLEELVNDTGIVQPKHGSLLKWARQGVMLWNYTLTGVPGMAGAHLHWGWDVLSREVLELISIENPRCIFVPWGLPKFGRNSIDEILVKNSLVFQSIGPETVEERQWYGSKPFTKINGMLKAMGQKPINWNINY